MLYLTCISNCLNRKFKSVSQISISFHFKTVLAK
nr:MAG TPA_asm: hypothetical protein [Caudoviricetes sp.]